MDVKIYNLKITFETPLLGTQPQKDVASEFMTREALGGVLPEDELETLPEKLERGTTAFHRDQEGSPIYFDYQVKGFLKEAGRTFNGMDKVKNLRSKIDSYVFVRPRRIKLNFNGAQIEHLERPLRAETMQGPRVTLARSEMLPEGTFFYCSIHVIEHGPITEALLRELLIYGQYKGLGQWRNGGYGQFRFELEQSE